MIIVYMKSNEREDGGWRMEAMAIYYQKEWRGIKFEGV